MVHDQVANLFHIPYPESVPADFRRASRERAFAIWSEISKTAPTAWLSALRKSPSSAQRALNLTVPCGSLLMPLTPFQRLVSGYQHGNGVYGPVAAASAHAVALINVVRKEFLVSAAAARIRLLQHSYIQAQDRGRSLFG
jgi:hypothetical protein